MTNIRKLAGRLCAATQNLEQVAFGGVPVIETSDISAALAWIESPVDREIFTWVWWRDGCAGRKPIVKMLVQPLQRQAKKMADRRELQIDLDAGLMYAIIHTALDELQAPRICQPCCGNGFVLLADADNKARKETCNSCGGNGAAEWGRRVIMKHMRQHRAGGVGTRTYLKIRPIYDWMVQFMWLAEGRAAVQAARALAQQEVA